MKKCLSLLCAFLFFCFIGSVAAHAALLYDGKYHITHFDRYISAPSLRYGTQLALSYSTSATVWELRHLGNDEYSIRVKNAAMDSSGGKRYDGVPIIVHGYHGGKNQRWKIRRSGKFFSIINVKTGLALDVPGNNNRVGNRLQGYPANNSPAQQFGLYRLNRGGIIDSLF
jgi:hypothetical protein